MTMVQGTCVEFGGMAVLLRGASGSGKSDLALRLIDSGARLVADDIVDLQVADGIVTVAPPPAAPPRLIGHMEVRGLGIMAVPTIAAARLGLLVDLVLPATVERLPPAERELVLGVAVPKLRLAPFEASVVAKLRLALTAVAAGEVSCAGAFGVS